MRGSSELEYLREGLVSLLSANLDGAGSLRSVDPHAVLRATAAGERTHDTYAPGEARAFAERLGAGMFVLGDVVGAGRRVEITAKLYDVRQEERIVARASVVGDIDSLFRHVDELTTGLLADSRRGPAGRLARTAALTTHSLPALKHYLAGEQFYLEGKYAAAVEAFEDATAADSTFALAYLSLAAAEDWMRQGDARDSALASASRHAARLPERTQLLIRALRSRDVDEAEALFHAFVDRFPDDVQGWHGLGELLFHQNAPRGRSATEARVPFEHVVTLAPKESGEDLQHLVAIAAGEGRRDALDTLSRRYLEVHPDGEWTLAVRAVRAAGLGDTADVPRIVAMLHGRRRDVIRLASEFAAATHNLRAAARLAEPLVDAARSREDRALGLILIAQMQAGRGRWTEAEASLATADSLDAGAALLARAQLAALPFAPIAREDMDRLRRALANDAAVPAHMRDDAALLGALLAARVGKDSSALAYAAELERMSGPSETRAAARRRAAQVRAFVALQRGKPAEGLTVLDASGVRYYSPQLRHLRAELLFEAGRHAEALPWLGAAAEGYGAAPLLAQLQLRQAQIHERLGNRAEAARHYARFTSLWRECDDVSRPALAEASRRLGQLAVR